MGFRVNSLPGVKAWEGLLRSGSSSAPGATIVDCTAKKDGFSRTATPAERLARVEQVAKQGEFRVPSAFRKI